MVKHIRTNWTRRGVALAERQVVSFVEEIDSAGFLDAKRRSAEQKESFQLS